MAAAQHTTSSDGTRIAYRASGSGDPVVLVHGSATWGADWLFVLPFLRDRFTVVTMDRRGRGDSADGPEYSMEHEAEDVLAVVEAVDAELLVAHSYGALCSILAAGRTDRLRRLVLYEPPIAIQGGRLGGLHELVARGEHEEALEGFLKSAGAAAEQFDAIRSSPAWPKLLDAVPTLPRELDAAARWQHPPGPIEVDTLFLLGDDTASGVYLNGLDDLQSAFPDSRRELIPGQRHVAHVFAAPEFAALVTDFL